MGIKDWGRKQIKKRDVRRAIQEGEFSLWMIKALRSVLFATGREEQVASSFDNDIVLYLTGIVDGLRDSEARLWGLKGDMNSWSDSTDLILRHGLIVNSDNAERAMVALKLEILRQELERILLSLSEGDINANEARTKTVERYDRYIDYEIKDIKFDSAQLSEFSHERDTSIAGNLTGLETLATLSGIFKERDIEKFRQVAQRKVGGIFRQSMQEMGYSP